MENASKALLMAGGILLGILILSGLVLMWTKISELQASQSEITKEEQIMKFNQEFETYTSEEEISGVDLISLLNKIESYNKKKNEVFNDKLQYEIINVSVDLSNTQSIDKTDPTKKKVNWLVSNTTGQNFQNMTDNFLKDSTFSKVDITKTAFKVAKFTKNGETTYSSENGQITGLYFKFLKNGN